MKFKKYINLLVIVIIALSLLASLLGILSKYEVEVVKEFTSIFGQKITIYGKGIYAYNSKSAVLQAIPHDMVTLFIALPLLLLTFILSQKGSYKARLVLTGILGYFLITYCMYTFISMYNRLFIVYVLLMSSSFYALILSLFSFNIKELKNQISEKFPYKYVGLSLLISTSMIALLWLARVLPSINGEVALEVEHGTTLSVQAFDLAFFLPAFIIASILLLKKSTLGYLFAPVATFSNVLVMMALLSKGISLVLNGYKDAMPLIGMTSIFGLLSFVSSILIIKNMKNYRVE